MNHDLSVQALKICFTHISTWI